MLIATVAVFFGLSLRSGDGSSASGKTKISDYCQMETFKASCGVNDVILMTHSVYGRMRQGRCVSYNFKLGCSTDVRDYMDFRCSGLRTCALRIPDTTLFSLNPCIKDVSSYLEAAYTCIPVNNHPCSTTTHTLLTAPSGTITNAHREPACAWVIRAPRGQQVNLTLLDFGVARQRGLLGTRPLSCSKYVTIREPASLAGRETTAVVCSGTERLKTVYVSQSSEVEVRTYRGDTVEGKDGPQDPSRFILQYTLVGCVDPYVTGPVWVDREGDKVTVTCNTTGHSQHLVCKAGHWVGRVIPCPHPPSAHDSNWNVLGALTTEWATPSGLVIVVGLGVGLGIVIGVLLLMCVLVYFKRKDRHRQQSVSQDFLPPDHEFAAIPAILKVDNKGGTGAGHGYPKDSGYYTDSDLCTCPTSIYGDSHLIRNHHDDERFSAALQRNHSDHIYELPK